MQIVINIPDKLYQSVQDGTYCGSLYEELKNGTPLPKGHGRLIDGDWFKEHMYACETNGRPLHTMELHERLAMIEDAPTIIEADMTKQEEEDSV